LNSAYKFWLKIKKKNSFKFIQISTDEVYGSVIRGSSNEKSFLDPSSPYSASKTSADHLVLSFFKTYNFPSIIVRPSNNYGPYQFPEKLIPLIIINAIEEKILPVYGNGKQIRNWLYVEDTTNGIKKIVSNGKNGNIYNIGGSCEITNIELVRKICSILQTFFPRVGNKTYFNLIKFVENRPGHDQRYSLDSKKIGKITDWKPTINLNTGLENTIKWYLKNKKWWGPMRKFKYKGERLGRKK
jgi:dTDP-glucose 4,6-dehydratase